MYNSHQRMIAVRIKSKGFWSRWWQLKLCIFVFVYLCVCGHRHMFPGMRLFVRKGLCVHPFCARFHPTVCCARIHSTTFTCGPRPRASLHPNLGQGDLTDISEATWLFFYTGSGSFLSQRSRMGPVKRVFFWKSSLHYLPNIQDPSSQQIRICLA